MIRSIIKYELKHWLHQYAIYFYAGLLFILGFSAMLIGGDILNERAHNPDGDFWANSPIAIYGNVINQLNILIFFLIPAIYGASINRDYKSKMHMILYSYPIKSKDYFIAKYVSASIVAICIVGCLGLGIAIGENIPGLDPQFIGPFNLWSYINIYLFFVIPNILIFGAIVYTLVAVTRNIYVGYVVILILILFRSIVGGALGSLDYAWIAASLDPYAGIAGMFYSGEWSLIEKNTNMIPIKGVVIYNRLFWLIVAALIVSWGRNKLLLTHNKYSRSTPEARSQKTIHQVLTKHSNYNLNSTIIDVSQLQQIKMSVSLAILQFKTILLSRSFISIVIGTYVLMFILLGQVNPDLTTDLRPFTQVVLQIPTLFYTFLVSLLTYIYAGYLVHRLRSSQMDQIVDSTPVSNQSMIVAHLLTVTFIQFVLISSILIVGLILQLYAGQTYIDLSQYCLQLYGITMITLIIWTTLSILVHTTIPNIYLGIFLLIIGSIGIGGLGDLGVNLDVFKFNSAPHPEYSDLTGYKNLYTYFVHKGYWLYCGLGLLLIAYLLWYRGVDQSIKGRIAIAKKRATKPFQISFLLLLVGFLSFGSWIYKETVKPKPILQDRALDDRKVELENLLAPYLDVSELSQCSFFVELDLFPEEQSYAVSAMSKYTNRTEFPVREVWVNSKSEKLINYNLDRDFAIIQNDSLLNVILLRLDQPLASGDSLSFMFEYKVTPQSSLKNSSPIERGGTYLMPDFPDLGIPDFRLKDSTKRVEYGLGKLEKQALLPQDSSSNYVSYVGKDFLEYEAIIGTSYKEMAITSGDLVDQWEEQGRAYFRYKSQGKIRNGFIFHSGTYSILEEEYNGTLLSIYHHSDHTHNNASMMNSMKATLDYCQEHFSFYPNKSMKIVEFPRVFGNFAQSFSGLISYSEQAGFLINVDTLSKKRWNSPFRLTAHEMSHQWWGHQVVPSRALGSKFVTEGLAEYTAAKLLEKKFGIEKLKRLIWISRERYFRARNSLHKESPLMTVPPDQGIVAYHKGCLALLTFSEYLGEENLHQALKKFVEEVRYETTPYPTSLDLIEAIESVAPDSLRYLIDDLTKHVILYDNKLKELDISSPRKGEYELKIGLQVSKYHANRKGEEKYVDDAKDKMTFQYDDSRDVVHSLPLNDYVTVAVYGKQRDEGDNILYEKKILVSKIYTELSISVTQEPVQVVIDPLSLLLDRDIEDNKMDL